MKQLIFILFLLPTIGIAQTPKTIKAAWEIQQADSKKTNQRIDSLIAVFAPDPKPEQPKPPVTDPVQVKAIADFVNAYYTSSNVELNAAGAVTKIKGIKGPDLPYIGLLNPTLGRPWINNGELVFTNQPLANFKVQVKDNDKPFPLPEEFTIVFRKMPGTEWEALVSGWGNYYIGFSGDNIRAGNSGNYLKTPAFPTYFMLSYLHCRFDTDGVSMWLNGKSIGKALSNDVYKRMAYGVGIETNSTDFNWLATMYIERGLNDQERADYFKAIESTYKIGTMPAWPYASEVKALRQGNNLVASYKFNGANPEDKSKVQYQWWKLSPDLGTQKMISTAASIPYQTGVKLTVKVTDNKGHSWMFISGQYN